MRKISRLLVGGLLFSLAGCVVEARRLALCDTVDGCDGTTYGSECAANAMGVDIAHSGARGADARCGAGEGIRAASEWCDLAVGAECGSAGECRPLGCAGTNRCSACLTAMGGSWVCLPAGAVC